MNNKTKATARPWSAEGNFISVDEGQLVQMLGNGVFSTETIEANKELIVKAVNRDHLFDELVKACRFALSDDNNGLKNLMPLVKITLEQVLAKCKD